MPIPGYKTNTIQSCHAMIWIKKKKFNTTLSCHDLNKKTNQNTNLCCHDLNTKQIEYNPFLQWPEYKTNYNTILSCHDLKTKQIRSYFAMSWIQNKYNKIIKSCLAMIWTEWQQIQITIQPHFLKPFSMTWTWKQNKNKINLDCQSNIKDNRTWLIWIVWSQRY